jgi:MFS family permease
MFTATLSLFILPIVANTGLSRSTVTAGYTAAAIGMTIGLNIVGRLLDRYAVHYILVPSYMLFAISLALVGATPPIGSVFLIPCFLLGLVGAGTYIPLQKAVLSWFDNKRAQALGTMAGIYSIGLALMPLLAGVLIVHLGWRLAYVGLAITSIAVSMSAVPLFVHARAERHVRGRLVKETFEDGRKVSLEIPGLSVREALRVRQFWMILASLGLVGLVVIALQINLVPMLIDRGLSVGSASLILTVFGLAALIGRYVGGFLIDRTHATIIAAIVIAGPIPGILLLRPPFPQAAVATALIGFAGGIEDDLLPLFISRYLGMRSFGKLMGLMYSVFILSSAFCPLLLSFGYESFGSYEPMVPVLVGVLVVCALTILFLSKYRYPAIQGFDDIAASDELKSAEILADAARAEHAAHTRRISGGENGYIPDWDPNAP